MSRTKKPKPEENELADGGAARAVRRALLHTVVAGLLATGCVVAFSYTRTYVDQTVAEPTAPPRVTFKNRPAWMTDLVAEQLAASFRPAKPRSVFDHEVLVQTTKRLTANPWVAKVNQVRRVYGGAPGDTIEVDCEFRAPMALVKHGSDFWFVDAHGVKLPEKFQSADVPKIVYTPDGRPNIRVIDGVHTLPPAAAGQRWLGDDLVAGLEIVTRLYGQPFADEIVKVNVDNFAGRTDPREAQIVFVTRYNTQIRWGRPWSATDGFVEVRPERKMESLRRIVQEYGRADAKQRWIDLRFDKITYPSPAADPSGAQTAGALEGGR